MMITSKHLIKNGDDPMSLRCSWCMKKIQEDKPCFGLNVKFREDVNFKENEGTIISLHLMTRNTSVPFIVVASDSDAKRNGIDGIFAVCSEKCGGKMKETLSKEIKLFSDYSVLENLR
jgi:hypothetical protein